MSDLVAARSVMAMSLGFHIVFAAVGMVMPIFMATAHFLHLRSKVAGSFELTKLWSKGVAILFAVGAVSGTVLSFELGLLWPEFMRFAGPIIGMPFSWEGTAFFLEGIAIGLFLYGWNRLSPWWHWGSGVVVGVSGFLSGIFVVSANAWMNSPQGFRWVAGTAVDIDPVAAMFNKAWLHQALHMQLAAIEAVGFAAAGLHAFLLRKDRGSSVHLLGLRIALSYGAVAALIQPLSGHFSAQKVGELQPLKLAAMESLFETRANAPLLLGGIPDPEEKTVRWGIEIPGALSFLAKNSTRASVQGLDSFEKGIWPPVLITHLAFQIMVGIGTLLAIVGLVCLWRLRRGREFSSTFLTFLMCMAPLGFVAIEAGWVVTEVGRQPWIIYGLMKTADALTPKPGMLGHFIVFAAVYILLASTSAWLIKRQLQVAEGSLRAP